MRVLVTGGSGFLGRNLLLGAPDHWDVTAVYNSDATFPRFLRRAPTVRAVRCDLADEDAVSDIVKHVGPGVDLCVFLAANTSVPLSVDHPLRDLRANTITVLNVLSYFNIERLLFLSSGAVYDGLTGQVGPTSSLSPTLPYAVSKLASEFYVRRAFRDGSLGAYTTLRFFGAFGPYEPSRKIYTRLARELGIERRDYFRVYGDGSNLIDAMYVDDAVRAILLAAEDNVPERTVDLASGKPSAILEVVHRAARLFVGKEVEVLTGGLAHEDIRFWSRPETFNHAFGFSVRTKLEDGLLQLRSHLIAGDSHA